MTMTTNSILQTETHLFSLPDGRSLSYCIYGASPKSANAIPVFYFHSYPASRHEAALLHAAALSHNLTLIAPDRPGMGDSTFLQRRRLLDWPLDLLALADHLHLPRFACIGTSGGGPYVIACYHKIPRTRLVAAAVVSGIWPKILGTEGMLLEARVMLFLAPWATGLVTAGLDWGLANAARDKEHPEAFAAAIAKSFDGRPEVDRDVWRANQGGFKDILLESIREAVKGGSAGAAHEMKIYGSDWDFDLADVKVQEGTLLIWHGGEDKNVPLPMAEKASGLLQGCTFTRFPEEGHLSVVARRGAEFLGLVKEMMAEKA